MKKTILIVLGIIIIAILGFVFKPVPKIAENKALIEKGIINDIYEGGTNDIVFVLENCETKFYINRSLEKGLELNNLKEKLLGNEIVFKYPKYWTPLDWNNRIKHLSKVEFDGEAIFSEF